MIAEVEININDAFDSLSRSDQVEFAMYCLDHLVNIDLQDVLEVYLPEVSEKALIRHMKYRGFNVSEK